MRDTQRKRLYAADDVLGKFSDRYETVEQIEAFLNRIWKSERFKAAYPNAVWQGPPRIKDGRGTRIARGGYQVVSFPLWSRNTGVILHEVAHTVSVRVHGHRIAWHGWEFCEVYLKLVLYFMGREAHDAFKASMKQQRVRFRPKRQRVRFKLDGTTLVPIDRSALIERLKKAREVKAALRAAA